MNTIGERIKEIRKDEHLTQVEFAQIFGLSHSHISNIENNRENLLSEWEYNKNYPLTPHNCARGTSKKVWWKCKKVLTYPENVVW